MTSLIQDAEFRDEFFSQTMLEDVVKWIQENMEPEDVFCEAKLRTWASENNYVRGDME